MIDTTKYPAKTSRGSMIPYVAKADDAKWVSAKEAAEFLGVCENTVAKYARLGFFESRKKDAATRRVYDAAGVLAFAARYPVGEGGRRKIGKGQRIERYIDYRPTTRGEDRYYLVVPDPTTGKAKTRVYKTLAGARNARDRILATREVEASPVTVMTPESRGFFARILDRLRTPKTEEVSV